MLLVSETPTFRQCVIGVVRWGLLLAAPIVVKTDVTASYQRSIWVWFWSSFLRCHFGSKANQTRPWYDCVTMQIRRKSEAQPKDDRSATEQRPNNDRTSTECLILNYPYKKRIVFLTGRSPAEIVSNSLVGAPPTFRRKIFDWRIKTDSGVLHMHSSSIDQAYMKRRWSVVNAWLGKLKIEYLGRLFNVLVSRILNSRNIDS